LIGESPLPPEFVVWFGLDETTEPTAVALIIHGLNFRPSRMSQIANMLVAQGVECLNLSLSGHSEHDASSPDPTTQERRRLEAFKSVSRSLWLSEVRAAYKLARGRADDLDVPLILVGFSLGAALGSDLASAPEFDASFEGMILFAPAFSVHWYTRFLRGLAVFPRLTFRSLSPKEYAANQGTPIAAYTALFKSLAALRKNQARRTAPNALIFVDPGDELVNYRGLRALCDGPGAERWTLVPTVKTLRKDRRDYHHLIIDEASLGSEGWAKVICHVQQFMAGLSKGRVRASSLRD